MQNVVELHEYPDGFAMRICEIANPAGLRPMMDSQHGLILGQCANGSRRSLYAAEKGR